MHESQQSEYLPARESAPAEPPTERRFVDAIALSPASAAVAIGTDLLLCGVDTATFELSLPFCAAAAGVIGYVVYRLQLNAGDDAGNARMKAFLIGFLTALPLPVTPLLAGPAGLAGLIKNFRGR